VGNACPCGVAKLQGLDADTAVRVVKGGRLVNGYRDVVAVDLILFFPLQADHQAMRNQGWRISPYSFHAVRVHGVKADWDAVFHLVVGSVAVRERHEHGVGVATW
jgi:hypothetical protein